MTKLELYKLLREYVDRGYDTKLYGLNHGFCRAETSLRQDLGLLHHSVHDLFPELKRYKPKSPWEQHSWFWFHPNDKQSRLNIIDKIIKELSS